ncbi:hypothetical protein [Carboxylicivirga sp. M1479]|uniref:hypothetical protein n=1 Tax=Carboxylicivirga sp. M1479 TaxID=2594476 RepID=UPI0011779C4A|nr:hypothetical protein [Carboxylicivirga sp. M1479]TRX64577.1 hypothetical protein FNN09_17545 [Carboxylicivirga sp. M1479]
MTKLSKILSIVLYLLLAITLVFAGMFFFGGEVVGETYYTPLYTESFLNWAKLLIYITAGVSVLFEVFHLVANPKNAMRSLISMAILGVIVLVAYSLSDATPLQLIGYNGPDNVPSMLTLAGTMLYGTYLLFGIVVSAILYTELSRLFK